MFDKGKMLHGALMLALCCSMLGVQSSGAADGAGSSWPPKSKPLFDTPLFPTPLFSDDAMATRLDNDIKAANQHNSPTANTQVSLDYEARIADAQVDDEMRRQMRDVARYLLRYGVRNGSRFPANQNDEMWALKAQLIELVPNNPYNAGATEAYSWGMPARYNNNGSPATGAAVWGDPYREQLQAMQSDRIRLSYDFGLNPQLADQYTTNPPGDWSAPAGTISAIGNNQGFFIVWGADRNGKPIKNPANGRTFVISATTSGTINDQSAPNPGGP